MILGEKKYLAIHTSRYQTTCVRPRQRRTGAREQNTRPTFPGSCDDQKEKSRRKKRRGKRKRREGQKAPGHDERRIRSSMMMMADESFGMSTVSVRLPGGTRYSCRVLIYSITALSLPSATRLNRRTQGLQSLGITPVHASEWLGGVPGRSDEKCLWGLRMPSLSLAAVSTY